MGAPEIEHRVAGFGGAQGDAMERPVAVGRLEGFNLIAGRVKGRSVYADGLLRVDRRGDSAEGDDEAHAVRPGTRAGCGRDRP